MKILSVLEANFTPEGIEQALQELEREFAIAITVHDCRGFLRDSEGGALLPGRNYHPHEYCVQGRFTNKAWESRCIDECLRETENFAGLEQKPFVKYCWKGVCELVVPVVRNGVKIITLFAGVFRKNVSDAPGDFCTASLRGIYDSLEILDERRIDSICGVLSLLGQGMVHYINNVHDVSESPHGRKQEISNFLHYNAHKQIRLEDLAAHLYLSPSRTSHLVTTLLGRSFQQQLMHERMVRARTLLLSTSQTLHDIASAVGISNVYYFNRAFRKFYGKPPGKFRKEKSPGDDHA